MTTPGLVGPLFSVSTGDRTLILGDSEVANDTSTQLFAAVQSELYSLAAATGSPRPLIWNIGASGSSSSAQLGFLQAAIARYKPTKLLWGYGTAPIITANPVGTVNDNTPNTIFGAFRQAMDICQYMGIQAYTASVMAIGEKWPTGANGAGDATIDTVVAGLAVIAARYPTISTLRDLRAALYTPGEPVDNPGNLTIGPYTTPDLAGGVHYNPGGRGKAHVIIRGDMVLTAASSPSLGVPNGSAFPAPGSVGLLYNPASLSGFGDGGNATSYPNTGLFSGADLVNSSATKPVWRAIASAGKMHNLSGLQFGGAAWLRSNAFPTRPQPLINLHVWLSTNFTAAQILYDGSSVVQELSLATLAASGVLEPFAGTAFNQPAVSVAAFHSCITVASGNNASSFCVIDGVMNSLGDMGLGGRSQFTMGASAASALPFTGFQMLTVEWNAAVGPLPRWQDVYGYSVSTFGRTPQ